MDQFEVKVFIRLRPSVLDPAGEAIKSASSKLGVAGIKSLRIGKMIEVKIESNEEDIKEKIDLNKIDHHLYGFRSVKKEFSSGDWLKLAKKNIKKIRDKNKIPVLVGGTGLYFKALTDGLVKIPEIPNSVRMKIRNLHKNFGQKKFFDELKTYEKAPKDTGELNRLWLERIN